MPNIEFKIQWTKTENSNAILRDTAAEIEIIVDNKCVTKNVDLSFKVSNSVLISAYPLAYWFAFSWWRLSYELLPGGLYPPSEDWALHHRLSAANWGYTSPNILFVSDGKFVRVCIETFHKEKQLLSKLSAPTNSIYIPINEFQYHIGNFVEVVLRHLNACNHFGTDLESIWESVKKDRSSSEAYGMRRMEAKLGFDPSECPLESIQKYPHC